MQKFYDLSETENIELSEMMDIIGTMPDDDFDTFYVLMKTYTKEHYQLYECLHFMHIPKLMTPLEIIESSRNKRYREKELTKQVDSFLKVQSEFYECLTMHFDEEVDNKIIDIFVNRCCEYIHNKVKVENEHHVIIETISNIKNIPPYIHVVYR